MSQQINLLVSKKIGLKSVWVASAALGLLLLVLLGVWGMRQAELAAARETQAASALQLQQTQARLQALMQPQGADLGAEIAALKPEADAAQKLLAQAGDLGSQQGYAGYFSLLATVTEDGLWLTGVTVEKTGKTVRISGHALHKESVLRYARRLNDLFAGDGVQFTALEISPLTAGKPGDLNPLLTAVAFKLY
jgi:type II secretory pathway pseudopilin PulG